MFALLLFFLAATPSAEPRPVIDPRGFHFTVPEGFEPFPGFKPTAKKLYAFGKNVGTPDAAILAIDLLDGPTTAGAPSRSCGALMNSMDRTVGKPITELWKAQELSGLRLVLTQPFGEVVVYCVDVPLQPHALSLMVSGKPANEALLQETFLAVLASIEPAGAGSRGFGLAPLAVALGLAGFLALGWGIRHRRRRLQKP